MKDNGKLTQEQMKSYQDSPMITSDNYQYDSGYRYPYFFDAVIDEAIKKYGLSEEDIMNRGYKIYTTLRSKLSVNDANRFCRQFAFSL